jgi:hypothetical protein
MLHTKENYVKCAAIVIEITMKVSELKYTVISVEYNGQDV